MKTKVSPAIVGAFVIGAFALGFLALLTVGGMSFAPNVRFEVYFDESVHGLDPGAPVKLGGVRVGRVVTIHVRYDAKTARSTAAVLCDLQPDAIRDAGGTAVDLTAHGGLQALIGRGLRAQLDAASLATGLLFVELDFHDPAENPAVIPPGPHDYAVVPSIPSTISEFQASATEILGKLERVDFVGLSNDLRALLVDARRQVDAADLKGLSDQLKSAAQGVDGLARSPEFPKLLANLDGAVAQLRAVLGDLRSTLGDVDHHVGANGRELQATLTRAQGTLKDFDQDAVAVRRLLEAQQGLGENANQALQSLSSAADAVERLADFLERNPNALVAGKHPAP